MRPSTGFQIAGGAIHQIMPAHHLGVAGRLQKWVAEDFAMLVWRGPQWNAFPLWRTSNVMVRSTCARWRPHFSGCDSFLPAGTRSTQATKIRETAARFLRVHPLHAADALQLAAAFAAAERRPASLAIGTLDASGQCGAQGRVRSVRFDGS